MKLEFYKNSHLLIATLGSFFLLSLEFPIWFLLLIAGVLIWRFLGEKEYLPLPKPWLTNTLALILFAAVLGIYKSLFERDASSLFFSYLCALKILEYKNMRDHLFVILLLMLLMAFKFLFSIDIWIFPVTVWLLYHLWLSLISCRSSDSLLSWKMRFYFIKVALLSLPLTFALYFMFPRLNSFLLKSDLSSGSGAVSGFGNEIHPGSISQLALSQDLAFRVEMTDGVYVDHEQLYWRGLVLKSTDGFKWTQGPAVEDQIQENSRKKLVNYKITMEPNSQRWLFPLDRPLKMTSSISLLKTRDGLFQSAVSFNSRTIVRGQSDLALSLHPQNETSYLALPTPSARVLRLVEKLKKNTHSRQEIIENIKKYFVDQNFNYTLSPGEMDDRSVDDFLFRVKKGYCEHFASAFAILARAAQVPARVVIGYQGADFNSIGSFYTVKAQDAHAWNEYVSDQGHWVRADLVDLVAPARIEKGTAEFLKIPENMRGIYIKEKKSEEFFILIAYDFLTTYIESLNFYWTQWLLDFNLDRQSELLKMLPLSVSLMLLFFVIALFLSFVALRVFSFWRDRRNLIEYCYKRLLRWALKQGMPKEAWEGPLSFLVRLQKTWPTNSSDFDTIVQHYVNFTYGDLPISLDEIVKMTGCLRRVESSTKFIYRLPRTP